MGLRRPYIKEFPPNLKDRKDWIQFGGFLDELDLAELQAIDAMANFFDLEKIPAFILDLIGFGTGAQITRGDSDRLKRQKIRDALKENRRKGTKNSVIHWFEQITNVTPEFDIDTGSGRLAIWESANNLLPFPNDFMKWESTDNPGPGGFSWGSILTSGALERFIVFIDTKRNDLTAVEIDRLEVVTRYFGAAYIRYHIGFKDPAFNFYRTVH